jgi:peptidoglycan/LPS O-acetylase OafA/YrhL
VTDSAQTTDLAQPPKTTRLHYLDWLRVILIFGVFVYHALSPFRAGLGYHITNPDQSVMVTVIMIWVWPWALPLFFLVAGAASLFALRRRSNRQYVRERVFRLLIPLIIGSILLSPPQAYLEALHKGTYQGSFLGFIPKWLAEITSGNLFTPLTFTEWGYHLWFLAFLFSYSLLALPMRASPVARLFSFCHARRSHPRRVPAARWGRADCCVLPVMIPKPS